MQALRKFLRKLLRIVAGVLIGGLTLLTGCQSRFIYFPRPYASGEIEQWQRKYHGEIIAYETSAGRQQAYLQRKVRQQGPPERFWLVAGGNAALSLDLADWLWENGDSRDAFLMIDLPGYGQCEGSPNPSRIHESMLAAVPAAIQKMGFSPAEIQPRMRIFAHSLGCAGTLLAAREFGIRRGILIAPFTSTMDMTRQVFGVNLGFLLWHRFDNKARLHELAGPDAKFIVFHGTTDEVIPVAMSREIKQEMPDLIDLREIPDGFHNDLFDAAERAMSAAMAELR